MLIPVLGLECLDTAGGLSCSPIPDGGGDISVIKHNHQDKNNGWTQTWLTCLSGNVDSSSKNEWALKTANTFSSCDVTSCANTVQ
jgi:hypothetical protein